MAWVKKIILAIRNIRGEMNIPPTKPLNLLLNKGSDIDQILVKQYEHYLKSLAKLESINWIKEEKIPPAITTLVDNLELHLVTSNLFDPAIEITRIEKELKKLRNELGRIEEKLKNPQYTSKAPEAIVNQERANLLEKQTQLAKLQLHLEKVTILCFGIP